MSQSKRHQNILVCNLEATTMGMEHITINLNPRLVRNELLEGRPYKVAPMVMITEGVHNGSQGKVYYPPSVLRRSASLWDHKPIVVYHPTINGVGVSACHPEILTKQKVGLILNTRASSVSVGGKMVPALKAEAWIDAERVGQVDRRVSDALARNQMMELSTGLFMDMQPAADDATWNGESYDFTAKNHRPDHLALLPDKAGACSIKDGAGFIRNQKKAVKNDEGAKWGDEKDPNAGGEQEADLQARDGTIDADQEDDDDVDDPKPIKQESDGIWNALRHMREILDNVKLSDPKGYAAKVAATAVGVQASSPTQRVKKTGGKKPDGDKQQEVTLLGSRTHSLSDLANGLTKSARQSNSAEAHYQASHAHAKAEEAWDGETGKHASRMSDYHGSMARQHLSSCQYCRNMAMKVEMKLKHQMTANYGVKGMKKGVRKSNYREQEIRRLQRRRDSADVAVGSPEHKVLGAKIRQLRSGGSKIHKGSRQTSPTTVHKFKIRDVGEFHVRKHSKGYQVYSPVSRHTYLDKAPTASAAKRQFKSLVSGHW